MHVAMERGWRTLLPVVVLMGATAFSAVAQVL